MRLTSLDPNGVSPRYKCFIWELIDSQLLKHMKPQERAGGGGNKVCIEEWWCCRPFPHTFPTTPTVLNNLGVLTFNLELSPSKIASDVFSSSWSDKLSQRSLFSVTVSSTSQCSLFSLTFSSLSACSQAISFLGRI